MRMQKLVGWLALAILVAACGSSPQTKNYRKTSASQGATAEPQPSLKAMAALPDLNPLATEVTNALELLQNYELVGQPTGPCEQKSVAKAGKVSDPIDFTLDPRCNWALSLALGQGIVAAPETSSDPSAPTQPTNTTGIDLSIFKSLKTVYYASTPFAIASNELQPLNSVSLSFRLRLQPEGVKAGFKTTLLILKK